MNESTLVPREELSDLDWLARNVHVWPKNDIIEIATTKIPSKLAFDGVAFSLQPSGLISKHAVYATKDQWLARRAELQNKPSWKKDAPEWAEWLAQDEDGEWKWLAGLPRKYVDGWTAVKIKGHCKGIALGDWRDTLEKRPADLSEQAVTARLNEATDNVLAAVPELMTDKYKFTPFTSIEDNQEQDMKQDNGWFEREELPPVGVKCETLVEPELQWVSAEVVAHRDGFAIVWITSEKCGAQSDAPKHLRPIRTERDVLLSVITEELNHYDTDGKLADAILAAGFSLGAK